MKTNKNNARKPYPSNGHNKYARIHLNDRRKQNACIINESMPEMIEKIKSNKGKASMNLGNDRPRIRNLCAPSTRKSHEQIAPERDYREIDT